MSANLTLKYKLAEKAYRSASGPLEELECLQAMLQELPKHKGTDKMQADLKQRISKAKVLAAKAPPKSGRKGFHLPRQGAGRAVIIGGPNAGKSQLLARLTNAKPEIAEYPFTTREPQPGMMHWEDVSIQLVDTPPITADLADADTINLIRGADLVILMLDLGSDDGGQQLRDVYRRVQQGKSRLGQQTTFSESEVGVSLTRTCLVANKIDLAESTDRLVFFREYIDFDFECFSISALNGQRLEPLQNAIFAAMDVVRVYSKLPNQKQADMDSPLVLTRGQTVLDFAGLIHQEVARSFKSARVWGKNIHPGSTVNGDYQPEDGDIVEIQ